MAWLTKVLGTKHLSLAEDIAQETFIKAFECWKLKGIPDNPHAWLFTVARNHAIDLLRKMKREKRLLDENKFQLQNENDFSTNSYADYSHQIFKDEQLNLMFICCDPTIPEESQIALILKIFCGLSTKEIARAFRIPEETIQKRIYRAHKALKVAQPAIKQLSTTELLKRLPVVLHILYLLFNEGYHSGKTDLPIRDELVEDAMRLCWQICESKEIDHFDSYALMSLFCFHASRLYGRVDEEGLLLDFKNQDRSKWNKELIKMGKTLLIKSSERNVSNVYFFEAAISYEYCISKRYEDIHWENVIDGYNRLLSIQNSPHYQIQKVIALGEMHGPELGLEELNKIDDKVRKHNLVYFLAKAKWLMDLQRYQEAIEAFHNALELTNLPAEINYIHNKITQLKKEKFD